MTSNASHILSELSRIRVIPVIKIEDIDNTIPLANALKGGGIPCIEITMRTAGAAKAIAAAAGVSDLLVGAGTVLNVEQARAAIDNGARFMVTPGIGPKVIEFCLQRNFPVVPGISNATDIQSALDFGLDTVKFFPAEAIGGLSYLKALSAPFSQVRFIPTGGLTATNLGDYLRFDKVIACGGTWLAPADLIEAGDFDGVTRLCRETARIIKSN